MRAANLFRTAILAVVPFTAAFSVAGHTLAAEATQTYKCARGHPGYCAKYGEGRCPQLNSLPNAAAACERWMQRCIACQVGIAACFSKAGKPVLDGSATCTKCTSKMHKCMQQADKKFWPNR